MPQGVKTGAIAHYQIDRSDASPDHYNLTIKIAAGQHLDPADIGSTVMFHVSPRRIEIEIDVLRDIGYQLVCDSATTFEMVENS